MAQSEFNGHYDATAAKGLCWDCKVKPAHRERVKMPTGRDVIADSLWCYDCKMEAEGIEETHEA